MKIDPKSIGVGQYQYDVSQSKLSESLDFVVMSAVNKVGVNLNSASVPLLQRVSGLNARSAKLIVEYRNEHGSFKNREDLKNIKGIGPKTLEQAYGFLRIPDGDEKLDMTGIHPESYEVAEKILERLLHQRRHRQRGTCGSGQESRPQAAPRRTRCRGIHFQ